MSNQPDREKSDVIIYGPCAGCGNGGAERVDDNEGFTWHHGCLAEYQTHRKRLGAFRVLAIIVAIAVHVALVTSLVMESIK